MKNILLLILLFFTLQVNAQTIFKEYKNLKEYDNFENTKYEQSITKISHNDSLWIIKSDREDFVFKRDLNTFKEIGHEYDIISLDCNYFGFLTSEIVEDIKTNTKYKLQYRWYSKSRYTWKPNYEIIFLFKLDEKGFPTGDRKVYKK